MEKVRDCVTHIISFPLTSDSKKNLVYLIMVLLQHINEFPEYFIDFKGNVCGKRGKLKLHLDILYKNKIQYTWKVHRLVAQTYIDNPYNRPAVDHIDRKRAHNTWII
jgi:hypothetical protein